VFPLGPPAPAPRTGPRPAAGRADLGGQGPGHEPEVFADGSTNIIDIAFDKRGRLYVLEIATEGLLSAPEGTLPVGRLVRVEKNGHRTTLASEGLNAPGGFLLGHGAAYITNNSILSGAGQVVKVAI
jgi:hypothetical protein